MRFWAMICSMSPGLIARRDMLLYNKRSGIGIRIKTGERVPYVIVSDFAMRP